jgi:hypothetical protein
MEVTMFSWILTAVALYGAYLNSKADKNGFYWWLVSNAGFSTYNFFIGEYAMSALFTAYLVITINGIRNWK